MRLVQKKIACSVRPDTINHTNTHNGDHHMDHEKMQQALTKLESAIDACKQAGISLAGTGSLPSGKLFQLKALPTVSASTRFNGGCATTGLVEPRNASYGDTGSLHGVSCW